MVASTSTLDLIQKDLQDWLGIQVLDNIVILSYNDFSNRVYRYIEENFPERRRKVSPIQNVSSSGLDLRTAFPAARDFDVGFEAYRVSDDGVMNLSNKFHRTHQANRRQDGYYILDGNFMMSVPPESGSVQVKFIYNEARTIAARGAKPSSITFGWDFDLEEAYREFMRMKYFDREQLAGNIDNANAAADAAIAMYFSQMQSS